MARPATRHPGRRPQAGMVLKAIERCGSQQALAEILNARIRKRGLDVRPVLQQTVSNWIRRDRRIAAPYKSLLHEIAENGGNGAA